ncbi:L-threonine dehydratase catabolic TdcB [Alphaproteobacteria bacterium SO-S41]|nr:L-threonine dehydratase catabolic TdcB [Alphaproteobacteria bacterium SO-S41]
MPGTHRRHDKTVIAPAWAGANIARSVVQGVVKSMVNEVRLPTEAEVRQARANIAGVARRTPLWRLDVEIPGTTIYLKLENLQPLGSFKIRAALNALKSKDPASLRRGVMAPSAGNFGQGLAWAARQLGLPVTIVAPETAAKTKIAALEALGAKVIRIPFADWWEVLTTRRFAGEDGVFFHPVADSDVIAGNATIADEILEDLAEPTTIIAPVGGGGLIAGIGSVMRRKRPGTKILAVESEMAQPVAAAFGAAKPVAVTYMPSFVDGMGSSVVLDEMWPLFRDTVDAPVCVSLDEIKAAIRLLAAKHHVIAEGAGAAAVAAAFSGRAGTGAIVCIVSGGNIDAAVLGGILNEGIS